MTKNIRIENADTSEYKVVVEVWDVGHDGRPDVKVRDYLLNHPTAMTPSDLYITSTRYLIVKEVGNGKS